MATNAKSAFDINIQRASYFLDIHEEAQQGRGAPPARYRELPRGALVFGVGALDAYLSEATAETLVKQLKAHTPADRAVLDRVQKDMPSLALEVAVLNSQASRLRRIQEAITEHFQNHTSNHGSKAIASGVQRIGCSPQNLWSALRNQGYTDAPARLDRWTRHRHEIVHQGKKVQVRRPDGRAFVDLANVIVAEFDRMCEQSLS